MTDCNECVQDNIYAQIELFCYRVEGLYFHGKIKGFIKEYEACGHVFIYGDKSLVDKKAHGSPIYCVCKTKDCSVLQGYIIPKKC